jgi:hypothetical protein
MATKMKVSDLVRDAVEQMRDDAENVTLAAERILRELTVSESATIDPNEDIPVYFTRLELVDLLEEIQQSPRTMGVIDKLTKARWGIV